MDADDCVKVDYWTRLEDGRIECRVCPRFCHLRRPARAVLRAARPRGRRRHGAHRLRPLHRLLHRPDREEAAEPFSSRAPRCSRSARPAATSACDFCQNWDISKSPRDRPPELDAADPDDDRPRRQESRLHAASPSPTTTRSSSAEYAVDTAEACRALGVKTVAVTAGSSTPSRGAPSTRWTRPTSTSRRSPNVLREAHRGQLEPVLETLELPCASDATCGPRSPRCSFPGENDGDEELDALTKWVARRAGAGRAAALHRLPPRLPHARRRADAAFDPAAGAGIGLGNGLHHVYVGNLSDPAREATVCPTCGTRCIGRDCYDITEYGLDAEGRCPGCGTRMAGVFAAGPGSWGSRRLPVRIERYQA